MDDEQLGFDIEFDDKTQAFLDWVAPERMESGVRAFLAVTVPDMADEAQWWQPPLSRQVMEAAKDLFGDWAGFVSPENRELADGFIRFLGECYVRGAEIITWTNRPGERKSAQLYADIAPTVRVIGDDIRVIPLMADGLFRNDDGAEMLKYEISRTVRAARRGRSHTV
ncbi:hypothetical protein ACWEPH_09875 [Nocardia beijingensis]